MNNDQIIQTLIRNTIHRVIRETIACVIIIGWSAYSLMLVRPGGSTFYGCLLLMIAAGFISGVNWSYTLGYRLLREHPASDSAFWREAFLAQARLLRLVPYWYLAPLLPGALLISNLQNPFGLLASFSILSLVFILVASLNLSCAKKLEQEAQRLMA